MHDLAHKICPHCEARVLGEHRFCPSCGGDLGQAGVLEGDPYLDLVLAGRYRIQHLIGAGAMGRVYRAEQTALGKPFAVKILSPQLTHDPESQARFAREAHNAASLNHPNVVSVVDYGRSDEGITYLVMEHIEGRSLEAIIAEGFPLERERIADLLLQILAALTEAHGLGILHRDLKPENILVQSLRTRGELLKVLDFGIAKLMDDAPGQVPAKPGLTSQGVVCGTPEYMSPEQACGLKLDQRSDLYAVGVILYQMLTGRPPFESEVAVEILHRHIHEAPVPPSELLGQAADPLEAVCMRALAKEREARYADAGAFREAVLEAARSGSRAEIHCNHCGARMAAGDRFCAACGAPAPPVEVPATGARRVERASTRALRQVSGEATADVLLRALPQRLAGTAADELIASARATLEAQRPGVALQVVAGQPGSGKTRLLAELGERAEELGWRVVETGCEPSGAMTALWPIREAVARLLEVDVHDARAGDLNRAASLVGLSYESLPGLCELFGLSAASCTTGPLEYAVRRRECFTSAVQALLDGGGGRPLLIVFDEVDRWDAPSRRILQRLARARSDNPVLVLVATAERQRDWLRSPVVELPPLASEEVESWAASLSRAASGLPSRLASHAPLTPFELELALRSVPAAGEPIDFGRAVDSWLAHLARPERQVAELAAVLGELGETDELEQLRACDPEGQNGELTGHLQALAQAGILAVLSDDEAPAPAPAPTRPQRWAFRSRQLREHLLQGIERQRARHLHREVAARSDAAQRSATIRALHLLRAQPGRVEDAAARRRTVELIEALRAAAIDAVASFDDPKAVRLLRTALKACRRLPTDERRGQEAKLIAELVDPFCFTDRVDEALATLRSLLDGLGHDPAVESDLLRATGRCLARKRDWPGAVSAYERALGPLIAQGRHAALFELYADLGRALAMAGERERALAELGEGLDMCTLGDGPRALLDVSMWRYLLTLAEVHERSGALREARTWAEHALFQAERRSEELGEMRAHELLGRLLRAIGQVMLAEQHVGRSLELARKLGDRRTSAELLLLRADLRLATGRRDDAERCLDAAERLAERLEWDRGVERVRRARAKLS